MKNRVIIAFLFASFLVALFLIPGCGGGGGGGSALTGGGSANLVQNSLPEQKGQVQVSLDWPD